jgi:hypothetical protein
MCEYNTKNKKIVSVFLGNKLCNVASRLRNKGSVVKCPHHNGHCTANLAEDAVIGNETEYRRQCTTVLNDTLKIANITTDGDSKSFNDVNNLAVYTTKTFVAPNNCFDDIWHVLFNFK